MNLFSKSFFVILFCLISQNVYLYEVDNFTNRSDIENLSDSLKILNSESNKRMIDAIEAFNKSNSCTKDFNSDSPKIYKFIKDKLDNNPVAKIETWAEKEEALPKVMPPKKDIYSNSSFGSGIVRNIFGLEPSIKLNGVVIGVDKLGHFMSQGHQYYFKNKKGENALSYGVRLEEDEYGLTTTGVKSYGDLGANYSGLFFWKNLIEGKDPYLKCDTKTNKAILNKKFDWSVFVNSSWDEGINCSEYVADLAIAVDKNLAKMKMSCPVDKKKCQEIVNLDCAEFYVSPQCLSLFPKRVKKCQLINNDKTPKAEMPQTCSTCSGLNALDKNKEKMFTQIIDKVKSSEVKNSSRVKNKKNEK